MKEAATLHFQIQLYKSRITGVFILQFCLKPSTGWANGLTGFQAGKIMHILIVIVSIAIIVCLLQGKSNAINLVSLFQTVDSHIVDNTRNHPFVHGPVLPFHRVQLSYNQQCSNPSDSVRQDK